MCRGRTVGILSAGLLAVLILAGGSWTTILRTGTQGTCWSAANVLTCSMQITPAANESQEPALPDLADWPDSSDTGVPPGVALTPFNGSCQITEANTVIDGKVLDCDVAVFATGVTIKNSKINGIVYLDSDRPESKTWSLTLLDSEIDAGTAQRAAFCCGNVVISRANLHGGVTSAQCEETSVSCRIEDSWLHGQYIEPNSNWHLGGFLSDGGGPITLHHNRIICDQAEVYGSDGGCTGDINLIPNFGTAHDVTITNNLLGANAHSAYCTYGGDRHDGQFPNGNNIVYRDNVFQRDSTGKCAAYGPVTGFNTGGIGNVWQNNIWEDGAPVRPEG